MDYYAELLEEIQNDIEKKKYKEANDLVTKELEMPYIPTEVEKKLRQYKRDLRFYLSEKQGRYELSLDSLLERLYDRSEIQLATVVQLTKKNLNECVPEIQDWLKKDPYPEAAAFMIEAIAEQQIGDEFEYTRDGMTFQFFGDGLTPVSESEGLLKAISLLQAWLENDHPDFYEMAKTLLVHKVYMFLPLSYELEDGEELALSVLKEVSELMDEGVIYNEVVTQRKQLS